MDDIFGFNEGDNSFRGDEFHHSEFESMLQSYDEQRVDSDVSDEKTSFDDASDPFEIDFKTDITRSGFMASNDSNLATIMEKGDLAAMYRISNLQTSDQRFESAARLFFQTAMQTNIELSSMHAEFNRCMNLLTVKEKSMMNAIAFAYSFIGIVKRGSYRIDKQKFLTASNQMSSLGVTNMADVLRYMRKAVIMLNKKP